MTQPLSNAQMRDIEALLHPYTNAATHRQVGAHLKLDQIGAKGQGYSLATPRWAGHDMDSRAVQPEFGIHAAGALTHKRKVAQVRLG